jgi:preprotein translocase SecF subunit
MIQWFKEPKVDFMGVRRIFMVLSTLACLASVYACVLLAQGKANIGTDFSAGVMLRMSSARDLGIDKIRESLKQAGYLDAQIQEVKESGLQVFSFVIKIKLDPNQPVGTTGDEVLGVFNKDFPDSKITLDGSDEVGPAVSRKLRDDATKAFMIAMACILIYIAWRFDFRFGVAAVITTIHDVLIIMGFVVLSGREFNLLQVTALLTLAGYSLNDTVVVFDRIRENMKLLLKDQSFTSMINLSVNETLSRTINTSVTVILTLLPLSIMGAGTLKDFALTLLLGVVVGTYSSIYVAGLILVEWNLMSGPKAKQEPAASQSPSR